MSILLSDLYADINYATGNSCGENSEPLLCRLKEGAVLHTGIVILLFHGDQLLRRVTEIIDRVVEAGLYTFWTSLRIHGLNLCSQKIAIVQPIDEYYSFNLYYMQTAFYLLLFGWCLSGLCFIFEVMYSCLFRKKQCEIDIVLADRYILGVALVT